MDQCDFPRCKNLANFGYIERDICSLHWTILCAANSKTEKSILKKIGLVRNDEGSVVPISRSKKS